MGASPPGRRRAWWRRPRGRTARSAVVGALVMRGPQVEHTVTTERATTPSTTRTIICQVLFSFVYLRGMGGRAGLLREEEEVERIGD